MEWIIRVFTCKVEWINKGIIILFFSIRKYFLISIVANKLCSSMTMFLFCSRPGEYEYLYFRVHRRSYYEISLLSFIKHTHECNACNTLSFVKQAALHLHSRFYSQFFEQHVTRILAHFAVFFQYFSSFSLYYSVTAPNFFFFNSFRKYILRVRT